MPTRLCRKITVRFSESSLMTSSRAPALGSQSGAGEANVMAIDHDHDHEEVQVNRRHILCGGGAAVVGAMITSLLGGTKPVRAASISGAVPEVDGLAVRVVTDSYQFAVAPSRKADGVDIQHFGWGIGGDKPPGKTLISEFGLSMHVESRRGAERRHVLVDFGVTPEAPGH